MMMNDIEKILVSEEQIQQRIQEMGQQLTEEYKDKNPIFLGILKGVVVFFADMIRAVPIPCQMDFMSVSSYGSGTETSGHVVIKKDVSLNIEGRHVVILEDIIDSGLTLSRVIDLLMARKPASLKICTLLDKPDRRVADIDIDMIGFTVPNEFVVGYGLDYNDHYRNLPFVGVLKREVYEK